VLGFETFATEDEAITRANATIFGLAASIFTKDVDRAQRVARAIKAGTVWTNTWEFSMTRRTPLALSNDFLAERVRAHGQASERLPTCGRHRDCPAKRRHGSQTGRLFYRNVYELSVGTRARSRVSAPSSSIQRR
jgi:hypothetical protein